MDDALEFVCPSCGFTDKQQLRDGVNNHWRKGYKPGLRPTSAEAICYQGLIPKRAISYNAPLPDKWWRHNPYRRPKP